MKLALLLPGFLDSPDYLHLKTFEKRLIELGYTVERIDPCNLWSTGTINNYSITNYLKQVDERVSFYKNSNLDEVVLIGHSLGGLVAIIAGSRNKSVTKIVSLCSSLGVSNLAKKWKGESFKHSERDLPDNPDMKRSFEVPYEFVKDGMQYSAAEEIKEIIKPIMVFIALDDTSVFPQETEKIIAHAHNIYVVRQPNMSHNFRHSQNDCNVVMKHIENFLTKP